MAESGTSRRPFAVVSYIGALAIVAAVTAVYSLLVSVNATTVALTLLLAVLGVATLWGLGEAVAVSVAAMLSFNYFFLPPTGTGPGNDNLVVDQTDWAHLLQGAFACWFFHFRDVRESPK